MRTLRQPLRMWIIAPVVLALGLFAQPRHFGHAADVTSPLQPPQAHPTDADAPAKKIALPPAPPMGNIRPTVVKNFEADQKAVLRYRHQEHVITTKGTERDARTLEVYYINGHTVSETIAIDGREMSASERAAEHQRALQRADQARHQPPAATGGIEFNRKVFPFGKLADDYLYGTPRSVEWQRRATWIYPITPNPNVESRSREEQVLLASEGEVWIDAADLHVVRISVHTFKPVRYLLGILAVIHNGSIDLLLQRHAPNEWLPKSAGFYVDATVALFKQVHQSKQQEFSHYVRLKDQG